MIDPREYDFAAVADTHAAIWYIFGNEKMSLPARAIILESARNGRKIGISSISLVELVYLVEKGRLPLEAYTKLVEALADPADVFTEVPFTAASVEAMRTIPRDDVPDMPDRMIAATGVFLQVPVLSRDGKIRAAAVETIW